MKVGEICLKEDLLRLEMLFKLMEIIIVRNLLISLFLKPLLSFKQFFLYLCVELRNVQSNCVY